MKRLTLKVMRKGLFTSELVKGDMIEAR